MLMEFLGLLCYYLFGESSLGMSSSVREKLRPYKQLKQYGARQRLPAGELEHHPSMLVRLRLRRPGLIAEAAQCQSIGTLDRPRAEEVGRTSSARLLQLAEVERLLRGPQELRSGTRDTRPP